MNTDTYTVNQRLESIFRPSAKNRRDDIILNHGRFVHYTSAENAMKIIESGSVWMRNSKCMNDYMEVSHGHRLFAQFFQDENNRKAFSDALAPIDDNIASKSLALFDQWWRTLEFNVFIASISEHEQGEDKHGRLSMWRAYGTQSSMAAIVLNIPFDPGYSTDALNLFLSPVEYYSYEDVQRELNLVIENIRNNIFFLMPLGSKIVTDRIFTMLLMAAVSIKHEGFKEEREWRIVYLPNLFPSTLIEQSIQTINGVPQTIFKIPLKNDQVTGMSIPQVIDRIIIGPSQYPFPMYQAFTSALLKSEVNDAANRVIVSNIPLRT